MTRNRIGVSYVQLKVVAIGLLLVVIASFAVASGGDRDSEKSVFAERCMGTEFRITICGEPSLAKAAAEKAFARAQELDRKLSDYKPDSELMILSSKAGRGAFSVSDDLLCVLKQGQRVAKESDGAFDVTIGPVVRLWRRARRTREMPSEQELTAAKAKIGYEKLTIDEKAKTVALKSVGMQLDLGGIAKGFAAQEMVKCLRENGCPRCLVAAGGDIVAGDAPPGSDGWAVKIAALNAADRPPTIKLQNAAISTSGGAEQYVEIAGTRYSHIVNPKTGLGLTGEFSVTVWMNDGALADPLATAAAVLGEESGVECVKKFGGKVRFARVVGDEVQVFGFGVFEK